MKFFRIALVAFFLITFLTACESTYELMQADPIPPTSFLPHHELLQNQSATFPFNRFWHRPGTKWDRFKKIRIEPVNIEHMLKDGWWQKINEEKVFEMQKDCASIGEYMREAFIRELEKDPGNIPQVVETVDAETLVVKLALVQLVPTKAFFNSVGAVVGFFVPGASLINIVNAGCVGMEGKVIDGKTGEVLVMFTDREKDDVAIINLNDFTWYGHSRHIIDEWARQFSELAVAPDDADDIKKPFPISLITVN